MNNGWSLKIKVSSLSEIAQLEKKNVISFPKNSSFWTRCRFLDRINKNEYPNHDFTFPQWKKISHCRCPVHLISNLSAKSSTSSSPRLDLADDLQKSLLILGNPRQGVIWSHYFVTQNNQNYKLDIVISGEEKLMKETVQFERGWELRYTLYHSYSTIN